MYPNQQYPQPGGGAGASYPPYPQQQQQQQQQQQPYNNQSPYSISSGFGGTFQQNMSTPYGGSNNPYPQGPNQQGGNPYAQNPYPPSGQQPYGSGGSGFGYPGQQTSYPPQGGGYPGNQQSGGHPGNQQGSGYPGNQQGGGYPGNQQGGYPGNQQGSGYPGNQQGSGYPGNQQGGYPGNKQGGGYPGNQQGSGYPGNQQGGGYPGNQQGGGYPGNQQGGGYPGNQQGGYPGNQQSLTQVIQQYEINQQFAARLQALSNCEIVVLCDDSGSMNTPLDGSTQTRWDELKNLVNIVISISAVMDSNGVDIYFLNREPALNVTNVQNIRHIFNNPPQGLTPLVPAIRRILAAKRSQAFEKKLLILIATDGAPTNEHGQTDIGSLEHVLRTERTPQTYISFLACTDDLQAVNYLSNWDKSMPNLDVIDDYRSERAEIQRTRGNNFPFSFGDYIVKALLGSIDPWFDSLDERA